MNLQAGAHFGSYAIRGPLGAGGMGEVYRGWDARLGRDVAIKVLPPTARSDPERLRRFEHEVKRRIAGEVPLSDGDEIRIGPALLVFCVGGRETTRSHGKPESPRGR